MNDASRIYIAIQCIDIVYIAQAICRRAVGEIGPNSPAPVGLEIYVLTERSPSANSAPKFAEPPSATPLYEHTCARPAEGEREAQRQAADGGPSSHRDRLVPASDEL